MSLGPKLVRFPESLAPRDQLGMVESSADAPKVVHFHFLDPNQMINKSVSS